MITIDKNIAPPDGVRATPKFGANPGPVSKYPFAKMVLGDSFFAPLHVYQLRKLANNFSRTKAGAGLHFATAIEEGGSRCWLVGIDNDI